MNYEDRLRWYRENRFTAADVTRATGLSERAQRELQKLGILQPVPQPNPKAQRLLNSTMLKRAAVIAPLNRSGLSLGVAGRIVYAAYLLEDFEFDVVDPWEAYYDAATEFNKKTGLFGVRKHPHNRSKWFDPHYRPTREKSDMYIGIVDSRFVSLGDGDPDATYGELTADQTDFVWWENGMIDTIRGRVTGREVRVSVKGWQDHSEPPFGTFAKTLDPKTIRFEVKASTDKDEALAEETLNNPTTKLTINASLTLRIALRRLLEIDGPSET